jgi:hypothetical protein
VPFDSRAVAGYIQPSGSLTIQATAGSLRGTDATPTSGPAHVDLFVYDASPTDRGEPVVLASDQGVTGQATVDVSAGAGDPPVAIVVAKLVQIPGYFTGADVRLPLTVSVDD